MDLVHLLIVVFGSAGIASQLIGLARYKMANETVLEIVHAKLELFKYLADLRDPELADAIGERLSASEAAAQPLPEWQRPERRALPRGRHRAIEDEAR